MVLFYYSTRATPKPKNVPFGREWDTVLVGQVLFAKQIHFLDQNWNVLMSQTNGDIEEYVEDTLETLLEPESLFIGVRKTIVTIQGALLDKRTECG